MSFTKKAECIRRIINNSSSSDIYKFDKKGFNSKEIIKNVQINSPKVYHLINKIKELDDNDFKKYGKNFKHIIYTDIKNSLAGAKFLAAVFKAFGMSNIYDEKFKIKIPSNNNNFALLSSVATYNKPFPVKTRKEILSIFNSRPDNIYGEQIRYLIIDQGYKEGIDVFDVKYVHLFDDLISPSDQKQAIGRGTRFCGQKGLEFNSEIGWALHVFKYKLILNDKLQEEFNVEDAFDLFIKESKIDINKLYFAAELENICRFGAVDYEINKAIHEFGNEKEDNLNKNEIFDNYQKLMDFKIKDIYESLDKKEENEFKLLKKAYKNFGGLNGIKKPFFKKKAKKFIDISKVKSIGKDLKTKLGFIEMRKYIRRYFNELKWKNLKFENNCISNINQVPSRIVSLNNSQAFVSNFFTSKSIYKGILYWHSVGTGKTCSAIATASNSFEQDDYTILWVTRHTLKPDIWKNIYSQVCSITIKDKLEKGVPIPEKMTGNFLKYLDNKWVNPISYKQFSNLIAGKNEYYKELVKRNGKDDPLRKTLIIIDEAHKIFAEDTPPMEKPNITILKKAIYHSYSFSKENSCKLLLMTATPYTNDPIQLFKLLNLLREDDFFPENFQEFKNEYLDDDYKFQPFKNKIFLDKISGYISYLNREKDARQFAYPVIYLENVNMSSNDTNSDSDDNTILLFMNEIKEYIDIDLQRAKDIINNLKDVIKDKKGKNKKTKSAILSQEDGFKECFKSKDKSKKLSKSPINDIKKAEAFVKDMMVIIKEKEKVIKANAKEEAKLIKNKAKEEAKLIKNKAKEDAKVVKNKAKEEVKEEAKVVKNKIINVVEANIINDVIKDLTEYINNFDNINEGFENLIKDDYFNKQFNLFTFDINTLKYISKAIYNGLIYKDNFTEFKQIFDNNFGIIIHNFNDKYYFFTIIHNIGNYVNISSKIYNDINDVNENIKLLSKNYKRKQSINIDNNETKIIKDISSYLNNINYQNIDNAYEEISYSNKFNINIYNGLYEKLGNAIFDKFKLKTDSIILDSNYYGDTKGYIAFNYYDTIIILIKFTKLYEERLRIDISGFDNLNDYERNIQESNLYKERIT